MGIRLAHFKELRGEKKMSDRISGVFWLVFSLIIGVESYRLELGTLHNPKAGFLPFLASVVLVGGSLILLLSTSIRSLKVTAKGDEGLKFNRPRLHKVFFIMASLFLWALLLNTLGFILCTMLLIFFSVRLIEPQKWFVSIITTVSIPLISYIIFDVLLKVQMPKGFLGF